ncbi:hypothetical protein [Thiocystis violacea]|uniref:hypothetical protein n=1 Tax=Thiocystis violacea TaxID=13725 RepID=UPI001907EFA9|nr:hypothetical protein [Thiocystis violacea]
MPPNYYIVSISDQAFFTIITSALEAYKVSHSEHKMEKHIPIETYGNLRGYQSKTKRNESVYRILLADVDTSATRKPKTVRPQQESFSIKEEFVDYFYPELEYIGDFHSHPYDFENDKVDNVLQLERMKLYCFSNSDFEHVKYLQKKKNRKYRLGIVATVFEMPNAILRKNAHIGKEDLSCIRFMHDNLAIWIKAYVFTNKKQIADTEIALACPSLGFHAGSIEQDP